MAQRHIHYDNAFEQYLRDRTVPYVAVDEAKRALQNTHPPSTLKSFDFVVYSKTGPNLLIDVKGRKHTGKSRKSFDNWVTQGDVESLEKWQELFGSGFVGAFAFLYWCEAQPEDALFQETFSCGQRWYATLGVTLSDYQQHMKQRSPKWQTVCLPAKAFAQVARPLREML
jgi:hypothetical protein